VSVSDKQDHGPNDPLYYAPRWIRERNEPGDRAEPQQEADRNNRSTLYENVPHVRHDRGRDPQNQKPPDIFAEAIAKAERQLREPLFVDLPPHLRERASIGIAGKFAVAVSVAVVIALGFVIVFPTSQGRVEDGTWAGLPTWQSLKASLLAAAQPKPAPTLIVRDNSGIINEPLRLGVIVEDHSAGVYVTIRRMPPDARLTAGKRISASEWRVPAQDISDAAIIPPADFVGGLILSAELHGADGAALVATFVSLTWTPSPAGSLPASATTAAAPSPPLAVAPQPAQPVASPPSAAMVATVAPSPPVLPAPVSPAAASPAAASPTADLPTADLPTAGLPSAAPPAPATTSSPARVEPVQELTPNEIAGFVRRAQELLASGDLPAARNYLTRAAEAHDARAALLLAKTFDPMVSRHLASADLGPDLAQARNWYQKAREWGAPEAQRQLDALASYPRK
jgi:hypothetical protein